MSTADAGGSGELGAEAGRRSKTLSPGRRRARLAVWLLLLVVVVLRYKFPPEPMPQFGGRDREFRRDFRRNRRPAELRQAVAALPPELWRIRIELAPNEEEKLRSYYWNGRDGSTVERTDASATVRAGDEVYTNVAIHIKGSAGSFRPFDDRPALTLNFSKHAPGQRFHGMTKLSLNNSVQDSTFLSEALCRELFVAAGVPVPKADHATVVVNGRDLGLYVLTEGWGKPFLRQHFKDVRGNLYDGGFVQDIYGNLGVVSGEKPEDRSDLGGLAEAVGEADRTARWKRLQAVLDVERFITQVAVDVLICNWDGYAMNRNNYRIFHDRTTDRLVFMPHGIDQVFGSRRMGPQSSIQPPIRGVVARAILSTPEGRQRYFERLAALRTNLFTEERLTNRVRALAARIRPTLAAYGSDVAQEHDAEVADLCRRIGERVRSVTQQLAPSGEHPQFDTAGRAALSGWEPLRTGRGAAASRFERRLNEGVKELVLRAGEGPGVVAWRTRVVLEPGPYRFEGRARTAGAGVDGGVCIRAAGSPFRLQVLEGEKWMPIAIRFVVDEGESEVDLVLEFAGSSGEGLFDERSLQLVRE